MKDEPMPAAVARLSDLVVKWALNIVLLAGLVAAFYVLFDTLSG